MSSGLERRSGIKGCAGSPQMRRPDGGEGGLQGGGGQR